LFNLYVICCRSQWRDFYACIAEWLSGAH